METAKKAKATETVKAQAETVLTVLTVTKQATVTEQVTEQVTVTPKVAKATVQATVLMATTNLW